MTVVFLGHQRLFVTYDNELTIQLVSEASGTRHEHILDEPGMDELLGALLTYASRRKRYELSQSSGEFINS